MPKFLVVSEGPSDMALMDAIKSGLEQDLNVNIDLKLLSPALDSTTGQYESHGWTQVKAWCRRHRENKPELANDNSELATLAKKFRWKTLVAQSNADGLIIQIDTDIAEKIVDLTPDFVRSNLPRRGFCQLAVLDWLNEFGVTQNLYLLLPSYAIESWILATHPPDSTEFSDLPVGFDYENVQDVEDKLINLGYSSKTVRGRKRLIKDEALYRSYGASVHQNRSDVENRCREFQRYVEILSGT